VLVQGGGDHDFVLVYVNSQTGEKLGKAVAVVKDGETFIEAQESDGFGGFGQHFLGQEVVAGAGGFLEKGHGRFDDRLPGRVVQVVGRVTVVIGGQAAGGPVKRDIVLGGDHFGLVKIGVVGESYGAQGRDEGGDVGGQLAGG